MAGTRGGTVGGAAGRIIPGPGLLAHIAVQEQVLLGVQPVATLSHVIFCTSLWLFRIHGAGHDQ